ESPDGQTWTTIGTARLAGLPDTVQAGLFATSPPYTEAFNRSLIMNGDATSPALATGTFDNLARVGTWPDQTWAGERIGGPPNERPLLRGEFEQTGDTFTVSGSGDIAPAVAGAAGLGTTITQTLVGTFAGLLALVVIGAMFMTAEYRRGL